MENLLINLFIFRNFLKVLLHLLPMSYLNLDLYANSNYIIKKSEESLHFNISIFLLDISSLHFSYFFQSIDYQQGNIFYQQSDRYLILME